jgi:putative endonuclease
MYYVYIITNIENTVLYTGITNNLYRRIYQHREKLVDGFSKRYNLFKLVYYEETESVESAILREKQIKNMSRLKKKQLVICKNREWTDLFPELQ